MKMSCNCSLNITETLIDNVTSAANCLKEKLTNVPHLGIICGTGLGSIAELLTDVISIKFEEIPHFPVTKVVGHQGRFVVGYVGDRYIICMQGRPHYYEGHPLWKTTMSVRVMKAIGITHIIITNAVGGINRNYKVGDVMIVKDHLNLMGLAGISPLIGISDEAGLGPKFITLTDTYDKHLRNLAKKAAGEMGIEEIIHEGVITCVGGPCYETVTECKMLSLVGVDAVGMSNVPEAIVAKHCGLKLLSISLVTNMVEIDYAGENDSVDNDSEIGSLSHANVIQVGNSRGEIIKKFIRYIINNIKFD